MSDNRRLLSTAVGPGLEESKVYDEFPLITSDYLNSPLSLPLNSDSRHSNNPHSAAIRTNFVKIITRYPISSCLAVTSPMK